MHFYTKNTLNRNRYHNSKQALTATHGPKILFFLLILRGVTQLIRL